MQDFIIVQAENRPAVKIFKVSSKVMKTHFC